MNQVPKPQYGYELSAKTNGQRRLLCGSCDIEDDEYLVRFCGSCSAHCEAAYVDADKSWGLLTPKHPLMNDLIYEVGGLGFTIPGASCDVTGLQGQIDLVTTDRRSVAAGQPVYAVSPSVLFRRRATRRGYMWAACGDVRRRLGLEPSARLVLTGNAQDDLLQWWWENPLVAANAVRANGFDWVLSPNYSIYGDRCPLEWSYNLKRSLVCYASLVDAGHNAAATLMVPNGFFRSRVQKWLEDNPQVNCIAVNLQMMRDSREFHAALDAVSQLDEALHHRVHFIITGPTKTERIALVRQQLARVSVISSATLNSPSAYGGLPSPGAAFDASGCSP